MIFKPGLFHLESHGSNMSFYMPDTYLKLEKKMEHLYDNYLNISDNVFEEKKLDNDLEFRNIYMTIANQNHFFDISTMSNSIENRAPLLDYRIVEYLFSIPKKKKKKDQLKSLYKKILSNFLPDFVIKAKKSGPALPIGFWLNKNKDFKEKICNFIMDNSHYIRNCLSTDLANSLSNGEIKKIDNNFLIRFRIFCIIIWYKIKIEKSIKNPNTTIDEILRT